MRDSKESFLKNNWKKYLFELLVIIIGITISFALQNWQESQRQKQVEIQTLERLLVDLKADSGDMQKETESLQECINGAQRILEINDFTEHTDSLDLFINSQLQYSVFAKSDIAYQGLRGFGKNGIITNQEVLNKIIHQYSVEYRTMDEWTNFDRSFITGHFLPHVTANFPAFGSRTDGNETAIFQKINAAMNTSQFKNLTTVNMSNKIQVVDAYNSNIKSVTALISDIEKELEILK